MTMTNSIFLRLAAAVWACVLMTWAAGAHAADEQASREERWDRKYLDCLTSGSPLPASLEPSAGGGEPRVLRARLLFTPGQAEPAFEWLWKGDERGAAELEPALRGYRLPCFQAGDVHPALVLLQEFWFTPGTGRLEADDVLFSAQDVKASCYDGPDVKFETPGRVDKPSKALLNFRFLPGEEAPEVRIVHSTGIRAFAEAARRYAARYKRCANGQTSEGDWHEQFFSYPQKAKSEFKPIDLPTLLGMTKGAEELRAHFDLNTMNCPFQVKYRLNQPAQRNSAQAVGKHDANRSAFLRWPDQLQLDLSEDRESALFGESLTVDVPCLLINLQPQH